MILVLVGIAMMALGGETRELLSLVQHDSLFANGALTDINFSALRNRVTKGVTVANANIVGFGRETVSGREYGTISRNQNIRDYNRSATLSAVDGTAFLMPRSAGEKVFIRPIKRSGFESCDQCSEVRLNVFSKNHGGHIRQVNSWAFANVSEFNPNSDFKIIVNYFQGAVFHYFEVNPRALLPFYSFHSNSVRLATLPDSNDKDQQTSDAKNRRSNGEPEGPKRPVCRVSSGTCGIPLSTKIGLAVCLAIAAWSLIFTGLGLLDGLLLRHRQPIKRTLYVLGGLGLFVLSAIIWGSGA